MSLSPGLIAARGLWVWGKGRRRGSFSLSLSFYVLLPNISKEFCFISVWKSEIKYVSVLFMKGKSSSVPGSTLGSSGFRDQTPQQMGHTQPHFSVSAIINLSWRQVKAGYPTPHTCLLLDQWCCKKREMAHNNQHQLFPYFPVFWGRI